MEPTEEHVSKPFQKTKRKWKKNCVRDFAVVPAGLALNASEDDRHHEATQRSQIPEDSAGVLFQMFNETRAHLTRIESKFEEQVGLLEDRVIEIEKRSRFKFGSTDLWTGRGDSMLTAEMSEEQRTKVTMSARKERQVQVQTMMGSRSDQSGQQGQVTRVLTREESSRVIKRAREEHRDRVQNLIESRIECFRQQDKLANLTPEEQDTINEEILMQEYAMQQIQCSKSNEDFLAKMEILIEDEWLDHVEELPGNMFYVGAFGEFAHDLSQFNLTMSIKFFMCLLVVLIQIFGPPLIFLSSMPGNIGAKDDKRYDWRCLPVNIPALGIYQDTDQTACPGGKTPMEVRLVDDWYAIFSTKALGICFMLLFILNGVFVNNNEENTWSRLYNTLRFLDRTTTEFRMTGRGYLSLGAFVNCWVIIWSCMDAYVIIGASANPKDLLMDALGLLFVYNLDDIGGDLGFLSEDDWPGLRIAWIYEHLVHPCDDDVFDEDKLDWLGTICVNTFRFTDIFLRVLLFALPVMAVLTPFTQIAPDD